MVVKFIFQNDDASFATTNTFTSKETVKLKIVSLKGALSDLFYQLFISYLLNILISSSI